MAAEDGSHPLHDVPTPQVLRRRWLPSLVWLVPLTAALIGASLVINAWRTAGPRVTVSFQTAQGLEIGKTLVKYRDVTVGHVTGLSLSADRTHVLVRADLLAGAADVLTTDAKFWVVRPRIGIGWASGLETLVSGSYIAVEAGDAKSRRTEFVGLEGPPPSMHGLHGKSVVLRAKDAGSLTPDAPVYFRRFEVGHVIDRTLEADGRGARVVVFIDAPYDRLITRATRFWNASGIDLTLGAEGMKLRTQSLASVVAGGIAFETAPAVWDAGPVAAGTEFALFADERAAMSPPDGEPRYVRMRFTQSLRGLVAGAPVDFMGVNIGEVFAVDLDYDAAHQSFPVIVTALIYPRRMGKAYEELEQNGTAASEDRMAALVAQLVGHGLRAQPRVGNLLTGQLYLALDFMPGARPVRFAADVRPLEIPTVPGSVQELQQKLVNILGKIDQLPLTEIGRRINTDLAGLDSALGELRTQVMPAGARAFGSLQTTLGSVDHALADDAPWRDNVDQTLDEARHTLRSVRSLTDYLDRHPEALLRGRQPAQWAASQPSSATVQAAE